MGKYSNGIAFRDLSKVLPAFPNSSGLLKGPYFLNITHLDSYILIKATPNIPSSQLQQCLVFFIGFNVFLTV